MISALAWLISVVRQGLPSPPSEIISEEIFIILCTLLRITPEKVEEIVVSYTSISSPGRGYISLCNHFVPMIGKDVEREQVIPSVIIIHATEKVYLIFVE